MPIAALPSAPRDAIITFHGVRMFILKEAIALVSTPPGSFVYHIIGLFALEAALAMALGQHRRDRDSGAGRLALAAGLALLLRLLLALLAGLGAASVVDDDTLLPPLDRTVSLATVLILGWALLAKHGETLADAVLSGALILVAVGAVVALVLWQPVGALGVDFNNTTHDLLWAAPQVGILLALLALLIWRRTEGWGMALGFFVLPLLATLVHLGFALRAPVLTGHVSAFTRIADLAMLPMFAVIVYRQVLRQAIVVVNSEQTAAFIPLLESPVDPGLSPDLAGALAAIGVETDHINAIEAISRGVGRALGAEIVLLWEFAPGDEAVTCLGGYDLTRQKRVVGFTLAADQAEGVRGTIQKGRAQQLRLAANGDELRLLADQIGMQYVSPALLAPLPSERETHSAVMVLSPDALSDWKDDDDQLLLALAAPVARALRNAVVDGGIGTEQSVVVLRQQVLALRLERDGLSERLTVLANRR